MSKCPLFLAIYMHLPILLDLNRGEPFLLWQRLLVPNSKNGFWGVLYWQWDQCEVHEVEKHNTFIGSSSVIHFKYKFKPVYNQKR